MKIYTRTGDAGTTSIVGGKRLAKDDVRIEAYGTVDELNSALGLLASYAACPPSERQTIIFVQNKLFNLGAYLASDAADAPVGVSEHDVQRLESSIDEMDHLTPPVDRFILPGGCSLAAHAHLARTICRRAERRIVTLASSAQVDAIALRFINRLSDWLFTFARFANVISETPEIFWSKDS